MKTILFLTARYPGYGGIENVTTLLANKLQKQYRIIICSNVQQEEEKLLPQLSKEILFCKLPYNGTNHSNENVKYFDRLIRDESVNVIIYQDSYFPNEYLLENSSKISSIKIIVVEHSSPMGYTINHRCRMSATSWWHLYTKLKWVFEYYRNIPYEKKRRNTLYRLCDKYVVLATGLIKQCQKIGKIGDNSKFCVIGNPLVLNSPIVDFSTKKKECLFVGRLDSMKGIDRMARIWSIAEKKCPDWTLVVVGDGMMMPTLKNMLEELQIKNIRLEGFQTNVTPYYCDAQIFCMCSTYEGFPLVIPEAMSNGLVPIAFGSFAAWDDITQNGIDSVTVSPFNEGEYSEKLIRLMQNDTNRINMQTRALENSKRFSIESVVDKWLDIIKD